MPRLLAVGHVTWDAREGGEVLGGSVSYASLAARKLGWDAGVLTAAAGDFEPNRDLPGVSVFLRSSQKTTRFHNVDEEDGTRRQRLVSRASSIDLGALPAGWKDPDALLLSPVAAEISGGLAGAFEAGVVGAIAQGWVRDFDADGTVSPRAFREAARVLEGVHVLFLSEHDLPEAEAAVRTFLEFVPIVALTRGWKGLLLVTREGAREVPGLPRPEIDPTGAGDVFAASFLVGYHETGDPLEAAVFACCAASCVVERVGAAGFGDRAEVLRRMVLRDRLIEEGEWDE
jgi:sugar/nucleoside kinase (ribokinase family)